MHTRIINLCLTYNWHSPGGSQVYEDDLHQVVSDLVVVDNRLDMEGSHVHLLVERLYVANHLHVHALLTDSALLLIFRILVLRDPSLNFDPGSRTVVDSVD